MHRRLIVCHIMIACRKEKDLSVSDMQAISAVFGRSGSPILSSSISSSFKISRTSRRRIRARRVLQVMRMDLRVLPAATRKSL